MSKSSSSVTKLFSWNKWVRLCYTCLFLLLYKSVCTQNLVPNGNFEDTACCPNAFAGSQLWCIPTWYDAALGTADFLHLCHWESINGPGFMGAHIFDAKSENGIGGFFNFAEGVNFSEYLGIKLTDSLRKGKVYQLSADLKATLSYYASDAVDFVFTKDSLYMPVLFMGGFYPQVSNPSGNIIADSVNWYTLTDTFKAYGGERYMTIGSFRPSASTYWSQGAVNGAGQAYVVIDNIKLVEYQPPVPQPETPLPFNIYPNPGNGLFTVTYTLDSLLSHELRFYNTIGQHIGTYGLNAGVYKTGIDLSHLAAGVYCYTLLSGNKKCRSGKLVIVR